MSEEEFVEKSINAVGQMVGEIEKLNDIGIAKTECFVKATELYYWLIKYQEEKRNMNNK